MYRHNRLNGSAIFVQNQYLCNGHPIRNAKMVKRKKYMHEGMFSAEMKLGDLIDANYNLLSILSRLDIRLGFGEISVGGMCRRYGLSTELFLMICRIYTFDDYSPSCAALGDDDLRHIVDYLRASHRYYTGFSIPRLREDMDAVIATCDSKHGKILRRFFDDYCGEVASHFAYEEDTVFPYIDMLLDGRRSDDFSIERFEDNHSDIDEKLNDMKSLIIKYLPEECRSGHRNDTLFGIYRFEEDLARHTLIEDRLLIPLVAKIERRL